VTPAIGLFDLRSAWLSEASVEPATVRNRILMLMLGSVRQLSVSRQFSALENVMLQAATLGLRNASHLELSGRA